MSTPTSTLAPRAARSSARARYLEHLREKNGAPCFRTRTLSAREPRFLKLLALRPEAPGRRIDARAFAAHFEARRAPEPGALDAAELFCLTLARIHEAEKFGADQGMGGAADPNGEDPLSYIELEEAYHTRSVQEILASFGVALAPREPDAMLRLLVWSMSALPACLAEIIVFCGEHVGTALFELLREEALSGFEGAQRDHVVRLLEAILADEREHVAYARSALSRWQISLLRAVFPVVAWAMRRELPEAVPLFGQERLRESLARELTEGSSEAESQSR